jgi:hypothetical protein
MNEGILMPNGEIHPITMEKVYSEADLQIELASYEGKLSNIMKDFLELEESGVEESYYNNLLFVLKPGSDERVKFEQMKEAMKGQKQVAGFLSRREALIKSIDESAKQLSIALETLPDNLKKHEVFEKRAEDVRKIYLALRNLKFTHKEISA